MFALHNPQCHAHRHSHIHTCTHTCNIYTCDKMWEEKLLHVRTYIHVRMHARVHAHTRACTHTHAQHEHVHVHIHAHVHTHSHTSIFLKFTVQCICCFFKLVLVEDTHDHLGLSIAITSFAFKCILNALYATCLQWSSLVS